MFRFFALIASLMLCFTENALAANLASIENAPSPKLQANKEKLMSSIEQYELAQSYYFGLNGVEEDPAEAYFWFSVCAESLKNTQSFIKSKSALEEMSFLMETTFPGVDQKGLFMKKLLVDYWKRVRIGTGICRKHCMPRCVLKIQNELKNSLKKEQHWERIRIY